MASCLGSVMKRRHIRCVRRRSHPFPFMSFTPKSDRHLIKSRKMAAAISGRLFSPLTSPSSLSPPRPPSTFSRFSLRPRFRSLQSDPPFAMMTRASLDVVKKTFQLPIENSMFFLRHSCIFSFVFFVHVFVFYAIRFSVQIFLFSFFLIMVVLYDVQHSLRLR